MEFRASFSTDTQRKVPVYKVAVASNGRRLALPLDTVTQLFSCLEAYVVIEERYKAQQPLHLSQSKQ